ncbi:DNA replication terminus site-binding protein [Shewanella sp. YLB-07]|uniref:DNA replication terminus site-binding protein n=1 Tax=Shewanella sp. YLB-07 TaxID=2601268 RepID=UPI0018833B49|nr:DNA replication terminus site-binding protein [Shewanella sp. YLB-07]
MDQRATLNSYIRIEHQRLVTLLDELASFIVSNVTDLCLFQLEKNRLGDEMALPQSIDIEHTFSDLTPKSRAFVRQAITQLTVNTFEENTYLAKRFPGFIVLPDAEKSNFMALSIKVNHQRSAFYNAVRKGFNNRQSVHENLHELLPNLVLFNTIRELKIIDSTLDQIELINFYWQSKKIEHIIKSEDAETRIKDGVNSKTFEFVGLTKSELIARANRELELLSRVNDTDVIVEIRHARVQPFCDVWARNSGDKRRTKLTSTGSALPIIVFQSPVSVKPLERYAFKAPNVPTYPLLNARKHWYVVPKKTRKMHRNLA